MKIGDLIKFGKYEWRVLDVQSDRALIISENILAKKAYHTINKHIAWQHSDIRKYLNDSFYNAFVPEEQARILKTEVKNDDNPHYNTPGGNDTTDKIFLLSIDEIRKYFADDSARVAYGTDGDSGWWWLRSPGFAARVRVGFLSIDNYNYSYGHDVDDKYGVRPALWLKL